MQLGPHAGFIIAAYAAGAFVIAVLIAWTAWDYRVQHRILRELDRQGLGRRRSARGRGRPDEHGSA